MGKQTMQEEFTIEQEEIKRADAALDPIHFIDEYCKAFDVTKDMVSNIKCFPYQRRVIDSFLDHRWNIILKSRQCLPIGTKVNTPDGIKSIEDFKPGDKVWSYNFDTEEKECDSVYDAWKSGTRNCVKFKLRDTRNFTVGENHPFYVEEKGWVKAKDLERGDKIKTSYSNFGSKTPRSSYVIALGYMITDGSSIMQPKFTNTNLNYINEFEECVSELCPELYITRREKGSGFDSYPHQKHGSSTENSFMKICEDMGLKKVKSMNKKLPQEVFEWDKKSVALLINRLFAGDGWVSIYSKANSKTLELGIASPCEEFLYQVKELLSRFEIFSNIYEVKNMKLQQGRFWKLRITHSKACKKFVEEIGIYDKITQEHLDIVDSYKHNVKYDSVIKSIKKDEKRVCYDISVDKNENFFVDGLLTHNTGISVITACYVAWRMIFGVDETIVIIANNQDGAARFLKHVKNVLIQLPEFLYSKKRDEVSFATMKVELSNGNQAIAKAAGKNAGRGDSPTLLVLDEWAFADDDEDIWTAAGPSLSQTEGDCIVISTPRGTGNQFHKMWVEAEKGDGPFNPIRVHWVENPKASAGLEYRIDQDGSRLPWSPWYEARCQEYQYDQVKIAQELDLSFSGSKLLALDPIEIARQKNRILHEKIKPKIYFDTDPRSTDPLVSRETSCHIFEEPKPGETFIIACDVAYKGIDKSTIQVINAKTLNQAAEYQGKIDPDRFAHLIAKIAYWYNTAFVVVEANNHGLVTGFELRNKIKYPNLYESKSSNPKAIHVRAIDYVVHMGDGIPGFQTTAASRPSVVNSIRAHMRETDVRINSSRLINEMDVFIRNEKKGGKEEAEKGYHDDLVMAYGIALYILSTEYYNQNMAKSRARAMLDAISFSTNELEGKQETPEEKSRRLESEKKFEDDDFVPPGAGGLWINKSEDEDEDDFNDTSWLLG